MKKKLIVIALVMSTVFLMACGSFKCDLCGQEKSGKSYDVTVLGEKSVICKDCKKEMEELKDAFGF